MGDIEVFNNCDGNFALQTCALVTATKAATNNCARISSCSITSSFINERQPDSATTLRSSNSRSFNAAQQLHPQLQRHAARRLHPQLLQRCRGDNAASVAAFAMRQMQRDFGFSFSSFSVSDSAACTSAAAAAAQASTPSTVDSAACIGDSSSVLSLFTGITPTLRARAASPSASATATSAVLHIRHQQQCSISAAPKTALFLLQQH